MARLNMIVEGQTEEGFINRVLVGHLAMFAVYACAQRIPTNRKAAFKGGMTTYAKAKDAILRWLRQDSAGDVFLTTMFDLYRLPRDFPEFEAAAREADPYSKVRMLEDALAADIPDRRFLPHIQLHEFETLLFCDVSQFRKHYENAEKAIARLAEIVAAHPGPEHIDEGDVTAPSKRIIAEFPRYNKEKVLVGTQVAADIGLATMRSKCPHFDAWIFRLEGLEQQAAPTSIRP